VVVVPPPVVDVVEVVEEIVEVPEPEPVPEPVVLAEIDTNTIPVASDTNGNAVEVTGDLITVHENLEVLTVNIPVALEQDASLDSFTDASGLTFENNRLVIPTKSTASGRPALLQIIDDTGGDLGTSLIIETENAVGTGSEAHADVVSIKSNAGFAVKNFAADAPTLGEVASTVALDLNTLPQGAAIVITTALQPDPVADSAFQIAASSAQMESIDIAYTINIDKINLVNDSDIESATITMKVSAAWVAEHGGVDAIKILRFDPDASEQQVLETIFSGYDTEGRAVFEGISPSGLSVFALVGKTMVVEPQEPIVEEPATYTLTITAPNEGGTTDPAAGEHTYVKGSEVSITAVADEGWEFVEWNGDISDTDSIVTILIDGDKSITANFSEIPFEEDTNVFFILGPIIGVIMLIFVGYRLRKWRKQAATCRPM